MWYFFSFGAGELEELEQTAALRLGTNLFIERGSGTQLVMGGSRWFLKGGEDGLLILFFVLKLRIYPLRTKFLVIFWLSWLKQGSQKWQRHRGGELHLLHNNSSL
jgi:hypothetical protein